MCNINERQNPETLLELLTVYEQFRDANSNTYEVEHLFVHKDKYDDFCNDEECKSFVSTHPHEYFLSGYYRIYTFKILAPLDREFLKEIQKKWE